MIGQVKCCRILKYGHFVILQFLVARWELLTDCDAAHVRRTDVETTGICSEGWISLEKVQNEHRTSRTSISSDPVALGYNFKPPLHRIVIFSTNKQKNGQWVYGTYAWKPSALEMGGFALDLTHLKPPTRW